MSDVKKIIEAETDAVPGAGHALVRGSALSEHERASLVYRATAALTSWGRGGSDSNSITSLRAPCCSRARIGVVSQDRSPI